MIKVSLTAAEFAELPDALKEHYKLGADGGYTVDLGPDVYTTDRDPAGLLSALEAEREETRKAKAAADRLEAEAKKAKLEGATSVEEVTAHFTAELEAMKKAQKDREKAAAAELAQQRQASADTAAREAALKLATDIFGDKAALMLPHVQARFQGTVAEDGSVGMKLIDPTTGQPSLDQSLENLKQSLSTNPMYKDMVVVSKASGGSANGGNGSPATLTKDDGTAKKWGDFSSGELMRLKQQQPEVFENLRNTRT